MPQTSSVCSCASAWNGQLASVTTPSSTRGSKPCSSRTRSTACSPGSPAAAASAPSSRPRCRARRSSAARRLLPRPLRVRHRVGQQAPREVVAPLGQGDRDRALGAPVELGRATGARPGAAGPPLVADVEQALVDQAVQVEGRGGARQLQAPRRPRRGSPAATAAPRGRRAAGGSARPAPRPRPPARPGRRPCGQSRSNIRLIEIRPIADAATDAPMVADAARPAPRPRIPETSRADPAQHRRRPPRRARRRRRRR